MCGLVGILDKNTDIGQLNMFRWMLHLDVLRGEDSTGVAIRSAKYNGKEGKVDLLKAVGHPAALHRKYPEVFDAEGRIRKDAFPNNISWAMGHNRAKTVGATSETNAHPFHVDHIVGCHNGTLTGGLAQLKAAKEGETDSEQIFRSIAAGWTIDQVVETAKGAMALTWWNAKERSFNIFRNKDRPLYIAHNVGKTAYAYASEDWMIKVAANKSRQSGIFKTVEGVPANTYMKFLFDPTLKLVETREVTQKVFTAPARTTPVVVGSQGGYNSGWKGQNNHGKGAVNTFDTGWFEPTFKTQEEFKKAAQYGCSLCQETLEYQEHQAGDIRWLDRETPLCARCSSEFNDNKGAA